MLTRATTWKEPVTEGHILHDVPCRKLTRPARSAGRSEGSGEGVGREGSGPGVSFRGEENTVQLDTGGGDTPQ